MAYNSQLDAQNKKCLMVELDFFEKALKERLAEDVVDLDFVRDCKLEIKIRQQKLGIKKR